ncbi:MAG: CotH kinase family protein [Ignavibacteriae bacterium]|nr:CotH kinase family protein [Ignavibacteriota bacterium]
MKKLIILFILLFTIYTNAQSILINEVMASNKITILDEDGEPSDWIELYNNSENEINLQNYFLSDDSLNLKKWQFENMILAPREYLLIFASDKDTVMNYHHTNFKISASGEKIFLSDSSQIIDQVIVPALTVDFSYGRIFNEFNNWKIQNPTPGFENNNNEIIQSADSVVASLPSGVYSSAISVELSAGDSEIYFTLDGSDPDSNSTKYTDPIDISNITILKAISYKQNLKPSLISHHSYFIGVDTDLPIISLITDPVNLFSDSIGIYANGPGWTPNPPHHGANFWMDWERPAHVQFFDDDKNLGFSENCGIEIYGAYTRSFAQKSFSVKFKEPYNSSALEYELFPGFDITTFNSFILRNSGNDFQFTHFRDAMMQSLVKDLDIDYLEYRPAAAYINGEYWGIYNIREKISEHYIANRHGVNPDSIDMLEGNMEVIHGDSLHYAELINYISNNDMTTDEAYKYIDKKIDIDNCLLYFAAEVYYNSQDWPANNVKFWRERKENGKWKWKWILFDLDFGFNLYETSGQSENHLTYLLSGIETRPGSNPPWSTLLPRKILENPKIKNKFINLISDLLNSNFKSDRVVSIINQLKNHLTIEGPKHRTRWGISDFTFNDHVQRMTKFAQERPNYLRGFVRNFFGAGEDGLITINSTQGGKIKINSIILDPNNYPWSGKYFFNVPIEAVAIPDKGYKFVGWSEENSSTETTITFNVARSTFLTATFSVDSSTAKEIVINEINYNSSDEFDSGDWIELYNRKDFEIDLSNWYFSDSDSSHKFIFPSETKIAPKSFLVLVESDSLFTSKFPEVENYLGELGFGFNGSGEFMKLVNKNGEIIDSLTYDDNLPWPIEADGNGNTLELVDAETDNSVGESWKESRKNGTPGKVNSVLVSINDENSANLPNQFLLMQNYPNPFNPLTIIEYSIPLSDIREISNVSLIIYDILGKVVEVLVNEKQNTGNYKVEFNGENLSSGIYFYTLKCGNYIQSKKMILLK